ncbi:hypothetical protein EMIT0215P_30354 [Pseudomonas serboccidentalis]
MYSSNQSTSEPDSVEPYEAEREIYTSRPGEASSQWLISRLNLAAR